MLWWEMGHSVAEPTILSRGEVWRSVAETRSSWVTHLTGHARAIKIARELNLQYMCIVSQAIHILRVRVGGARKGKVEGEKYVWCIWTSFCVLGNVGGTNQIEASVISC